MKEGIALFKHEKQLFHPVAVEKPNGQYAVLLQEQLGGGNGELKAAMQYISQSFRIKDPTIKDLFLDIGAEELGHMEMVAQTINLLNGHDVDYTQVDAGNVQAHVITGLNPGLINASGYSWTADYVTVTGDLCADLMSNIASEQRAKVVYEYLYRQIEDKKVRETIDFLLNREEAHNALFQEAFRKVQDTGSNRDFGVTGDSLFYANMSTPSPEEHFDRSPGNAPRFETPKEKDREFSLPRR
jgi:Mn-containing catalase